MQVLSVNISNPQTINWRGKKMQTGIFKNPVDKPIFLGKNEVKFGTSAKIASAAKKDAMKQLKVNEFKEKPKEITKLAIDLLKDDFKKYKSMAK